MAKIDVTPEELLQMIGKQQIIIEKQSTALNSYPICLTRNHRNVMNYRLNSLRFHGIIWHW